jgi:hypothetical protein
LRRSILACGLLLALAGMATAAAAAARSNSTEGSPSSTTTSSVTTAVTTNVEAGSTHTSAQAVTRWRRHIRRFRADTRHWLTVMTGRPPGNVPRSLAARSPAQIRELARLWRRRAHRAWWHAKHPPRLRDWLCIHRYEGSWSDSDSPYWGGLQMDLSFQETYGGWLLRHKGTAENWSPLEQIWVAVRASRARGFSPWATTARYCGVY